MEAISSSICKKIPWYLGRSRDIISVISEAGVIGYPAKKRQPAAMAPRAQASFPWMTKVSTKKSFSFSWIPTGRKKILGKLLHYSKEPFKIQSWEEITCDSDPRPQPSDLRLNGKMARDSTIIKVWQGAQNPLRILQGLIPYAEKSDV
jgi:hypothetical protein